MKSGMLRKGIDFLGSVISTTEKACKCFLNEDALSTVNLRMCF